MLRLFLRGVGTGNYSPLTTILTHLFCFVHIHQISRSFVPCAFHTALLKTVPFWFPVDLFHPLQQVYVYVRRGLDQLLVVCQTLRGGIDCPELYNLFCWLYVLLNYYAHSQSHRRKLFPQQVGHTVAREESLVCRTLEALNTRLINDSECDFFVDRWSGNVSVFNVL